jgi:predicted ATPase
MTKDSVFIHGVALSNYRGIGDEPQLIGPFEQFNFFIGPNNSGKSTVLNFISKHLVPIVSENRYNPNRESPAELDQLDIALGKNRTQVRMGLGIRSEDVEDIFKEIKTNNVRVSNLLTQIIKYLSIDGLIWVERDQNSKALKSFNKETKSSALRGLAHPSDWQGLWNALLNMHDGDIDIHWIPETIGNIFSQIETPKPKISIIPAIREISQKGQSFNDWSGKGLIEEIAAHQNPKYNERTKFKKFNKINAFLKSVTDNSSASIEIPHDREHVLIHIDGKVLPLHNLGTGIHEVVMLASFCTLAENQVVCIEEPEIHLHPVLQRRLINYLQSETKNQYFIATHSASLIDTPGAAIFHARSINGKTTIQYATTSSSKYDICRDLGYKASDILQSNAVIWVEGPSDRIYIRHWLQAKNPSLQEGIDYSIMFYGGRLLSHLSIEEKNNESEINKFIELKKLNRNSAIIIDSDRSKAKESINETKARIAAESEKDGFSWITAGREIENYIDKETLSTALAKRYKNYKERLKTGQYDHALPFKDSTGKKIENIDKVGIANIVCENLPNLEVLDLKDKITKLAEFIEKANSK